MTSEDPSHDETLPATETVDDHRRATTAPTDAVELPRPLAAYTLGAVIGSGGMGEVLVARDRKIGREVALKRLKTRDPSDDLVSRFLREARIQALLDHPAIVPVHELGDDADGRPYFTMKRLAGTTLAQRLAEGGTVQPLLRAFADVCHAVDLAHTRGVIHRDLKPANIMLGGYGEVYVLDWGLARVIGNEEGTLAAADIPSGEGETSAGDLLGTPGYMAPEQIQDAASVERPADVYSLGAILFEILAGAPLHPRGQAAIATTVEGIDGSPGRRATDHTIPPELDALCVSMLAQRPAMRPSAHQVAIQIEAYLDGDRDVAARRALALEHLARARMAFASKLRADAMRAAGSALALDPENRDAAELVSRLMLEPPEVPPRELAAALAAADAHTVSRHARSSMFAFIGVLVLFVPLTLWNGVYSWSVFGSIFALVGVLVTCAFLLSRWPQRGPREVLVYFAGSSLLLALVERLFGPLLCVPALACVITMSSLMYPQHARRPALVIGITLVGWLGPIVLEAAGILEQTWSITGGAVVSTSHVMVVGGIATVVFVFGLTLATIVVGSMHGATLSRSNLDAQHRLVGQAWHLQQLLPSSVTSAPA